MAHESANSDAKNGEHNTESFLDRRDVLRMGATAAALGFGSASVSGTAAAATKRYGISFNRVVNAVDDLGMDPNGNRPIDDELRQTMNRGDTLVEFPPGTYYLADQHSEGSLSNWGVRGLGDHPTDVKLVTDPGRGEKIIKCGDGRGVLIENVSFDYSQRKRGSLGLVLKVRDDLRVQDVHFVGFNPNEEEGGVVNLSPQVLSRSGTAIVDGFVRTGATDIRPHRHLAGPANPPGIMWLGKKHVGRLVVRNSHLHNAGENGIYASAPSGDVRIEDSVFKNCNQAALRMGGQGSYIKNTTFLIDTEDSENENGLINPHAVIWETDKRGETGGFIENCDFIYRNAPQKTTAAIWADGSAGAFTIRDTRIQLDEPNIAAIKLDDPRSSRLGITSERPWGVTLDNVNVTGSGSGKLPTIEVINRPKTVIKNSCLKVSGDRDGVCFRDSNDGEIANTDIDVGGRATIFDSSSVSTSNISKSARCPLVDSSGGSGGSDDGSDGGSDDSSDGGSDDGGQSPSPDASKLVVHGPSKDIGRVDYKIRFDGDADSISAAPGELSDGVFEGSVWAGRADAISLDGSITSIDKVTEGGRVTLDGEDITPITTSNDEPEPKELTVYGPSKDIGRVDYKIRFDGDAESVSAAPSELGDGVFEGSVWAGHADTISLAGSVESIDLLTEGGTVSLGDKDITPKRPEPEPEPEPQKLTVYGPSKDIGRVDYKIRFDGDAESVSAAPDELNDGVFEGSVWAGHADTISLTGSVESIDTLTEGGTVSLGDKDITPKRPEPEPEPEPKELTVYGPSKDIGRVDYKIRFDGDAESVSAASNELGDGVFEGSVWAGHADTISLTGTVTAIDTLTEGGTVSLGDVDITPESTKQQSAEPKKVVVHGPSKDIGRVDYKIRFDGDAESISAASNELGDGVFEGSVWAGHADAISLTGSLTSVEMLTEGGRLTVDGDEVDPDAVGAASASSQVAGLPNTITVDGANTEGTTGYEFTVSGELQRDDEASTNEQNTVLDSLSDNVSDNSVVGLVDEGVDVYRFSGDITASKINGNAAVDFDDNDN